MFALVFLPALIGFMIVNAGALSTALAGGPPINSADSDIIMALPAAMAGIALGWLFARGEPPPAEGRDEIRHGEGL